ncbi:MAG: hypothetical protein SGJ21_12460 [Alphaproteobacteria bacterium]|nr:hypothetical protein [Alphaproteobacteria bacterium]
MTQAERAAAIRAYLARLSRSLSRLPPGDRAAITAEIGSHLAQRTLRVGAESALLELGSPDQANGR